MDVPPKMPHQPHDKILRVVTSFDPAKPDRRVVVLEFAKQCPVLCQHIPGACHELKPGINLGGRLSILRAGGKEHSVPDAAIGLKDIAHGRRADDQVDSPDSKPQ